MLRYINNKMTFENVNSYMFSSVIYIFCCAVKIIEKDHCAIRTALMSPADALFTHIKIYQRV